MTELPQAWASAVVGEVVADLKPGFPSGRHNESGLGVPHLRPMNIDRDGRIDLAKLKYVEVPAAARIERGQVLFNNTNSPELVGKTAYFDHEGEWALSNHMTRLTPSRAIDGQFLAIQLHWFWSRGLYQTLLSNHVNQASVSRTALSTQVEVVVPPLDEQRRIVAAIEEQFSRLDVAEGGLYQVKNRLAVFRASILDKAFRGSWMRVRIGDVALVGSGATPRRGREDYWVGGTIPWVTSGQLLQPFVREPTAFITKTALRETNVKLWPRHTLLVALYGEGKTRGHCSELLIESTTNQACAAVRLHDEHVETSYLKLFFAASYDANRRLATGGVQPNLSLGLIKNMEFPLPPLEEQRRIVAEVEQQLSVIDAMRVAIEAAQKRGAALRRSILELAFTGKLVPQDPDDEPASALLERIRAERAVKEPSRRAVRSGR